MDETTTKEAKKGGGVVARQALYSKLAVHVPKAIEKLVELLDSRNESIRLGAINKILDKAIPDLKAMEMTGKDGEDMKLVVKIVRERELPKVEDGTTTNRISNPELSGAGKDI